jgi:hypothetical protein
VIATIAPSGSIDDCGEQRCDGLDDPFFDHVLFADPGFEGA